MVEQGVRLDLDGIPSLQAEKVSKKSSFAGEAPSKHFTLLLGNAADERFCAYESEEDSFLAVQYVGR
jgi:hypothetical protein